MRLEKSRKLFFIWFSKPFQLLLLLKVSIPKGIVRARHETEDQSGETLSGGLRARNAGGMDGSNARIHRYGPLPNGAASVAVGMRSVRVGRGPYPLVRAAPRWGEGRTCPGKVAPYTEKRFFCVNGRLPERGGCRTTRTGAIPTRLAALPATLGVWAQDWRSGRASEETLRTDRPAGGFGPQFRGPFRLAPGDVEVRGPFQGFGSALGSISLILSEDGVALYQQRFRFLEPALRGQGSPRTLSNRRPSRNLAVWP